jgi:RimJ/RimL family protein N-acetyltransferase
MPFIATPLVGRWVHLEPMNEDHREPLRVAADDERIWQHTLFDGCGPEFDQWFDDYLALHRAGRQIPFAVRRKSDEQLIGSTGYLDVFERHKRIEIGGTWYSPDAWGTAINPECKLLLLQHAFEVFGVNRVALVTDLRNERSQAAIAKLGAVREGVLRKHMITQGSRIRDSVVFSIVVEEWPKVRDGLEARLAQALQ